MQHKCYAIVILFFATTAFAEILFTFPPPLAGAYPFYVHRYSGTPTDPNLPPNVPLTGKMATVLNNDSYGEIVLTTYDRLFTRQLTSILFAKLPKAIVVIPPFPDFPGFEQYTHDDYFEQPKLWNIPIGSIHFQTGMKAWAILADNMTADVTLVFQPNPWQTFADNPSWILIGPVLISGMVLFAFGLSIARLHQFVRAEGFKVTVAQVTLIIQIIINPLIAWWWLVDPAKTRMVIPNQVDNVVEAGTQTAAVTVCIYLGIFFWQELLSKTAIRVAVFVNKLKVPMILVVVAVLMLEYASSVVFTVASLDPSQITQTFTKVRYGIDMALVGITFIYYTIVSIQVMVYIRKMKSGTKDVKKATIRFAIVGFAQLLRVLSDIFPLDGMYLEKTGMLLVLDPVVFRLGHHWLRYLSIAITNLALVSGFRVPQRRGAGLTTGTTRTGLSSSA